MKNSTLSGVHLQSSSRELEIRDDQNDIEKKIDDDFIDKHESINFKLLAILSGHC